MRLTNIKKGGILKFDFNLKNGTPAILTEMQVLDSKDIKQDVFKESLKNGQIKLYMDAGWLVDTEKFEKEIKKKESKKEIKKKVKPKKKRGGKK